MKSLRRIAKKSQKPTIGNFANIIITIDDLKKKGLLRTTDYGVFYTYPEILTTPTATKNLYIYARVCKLIQPGSVLAIRHIESNELLTQYS